MQLSAMMGAKGDIFWDLDSCITYEAGYDLGCSIHVANPGNQAQEYTLMAHLASGTAVISEEALPVFGCTKFTVDPGDLVELEGALRFTSSNAVLTVNLMDPDTGEIIDSVATMLIAPTTTAALPPSSTTGASDWTSLLNSMMPILMLVMMGMIMAAAFKPREERALPAGRSD